jgi:hypothetical protein
MQLFDQTVVYEIDFMKLLEEGDNFQMALNHAREKKREEIKELKDKVSLSRLISYRALYSWRFPKL